MRYINSVPQIIDGNGYIIVGAKYFYDPKSARLKSIYTDSSFTTEQSNPLTSDANGRFNDMFLEGIYREVQKDDDGVVLWSKEIGDILDSQAQSWVNDKAYNISDIAQGSDNSYYRSLANDNQGNNPTTDAANWEKLSLLSLENSTPILFFNETDASVDNKKWDIRIVSEQFLLRIINDAEDTTFNVLEIDRTGTTVDTINFNGILQSQGNNVLTPDVTIEVQGYDFRPAFYSGLNKALTEDTVPEKVLFDDTGTIMFMLGDTTNLVYSYTLSTPWDASTISATADIPLNVGTQDSVPKGLYASSDGLNLYMIGRTSNTVYQYTGTVAWDINTFSYASKSFSVAAEDVIPVGVAFSSDGAIMYMVGQTSDTVYQYTLSTPWDVSTASYASKSLSVAAQDTAPEDIWFSEDGYYMFMIGAINQAVFKYALTTAGDISTGSYTNESFDISSEETVPTSITFSRWGANMYVIGTANKTVYQYKTHFLRL